MYFHTQTVPESRVKPLLRLQVNFIRIIEDYDEYRAILVMEM